MRFFLFFSRLRGSVCGRLGCNRRRESVSSKTGTVNVARRCKKVRTPLDDPPQLPVLRSCPVLQERLVEQLNHPSLPLSIRHRYDSITLTPHPARVKRPVRAIPATSTRFAGTSVVLPLVQARSAIVVNAIMAHTTIFKAVHGIISGKKVLFRRRACIIAVHVHRCTVISLWYSEPTIVVIVVERGLARFTQETGLVEGEWIFGECEVVEGVTDGLGVEQIKIWEVLLWMKQDAMALASANLKDNMIDSRRR